MMENKWHLPVLQKEVLRAFQEQPKVPVRFLEGTFGRGGHAFILLNEFPQSRIVSFDRDRDAVDFAGTHFGDFLKEGRLRVIHDDFRNLKNHALGSFDGALFDLGASSPQFDVAERGFSFSHDGPLDMRMDQSQSLSAGQIVNEFSERDLIDLFMEWGEVRRPQRVVRAIVHDRKEIPFSSTRQLASLIERVDGWRGGARRKGLHPATSYFMALRICVNQELDNLSEFFESMHHHLEPGGRLVVISFHSLEDRIVKTVFRKMDKKYGRIINKKVITATSEELSHNPRARSAKMRIFQREASL